MEGSARAAQSQLKADITAEPRRWAAGEVQTLVDNLYPRNEAGLGFTHRFKRVTITEGSLSYEKVVGKEVEPRPEAATF